MKDKKNIKVNFVVASITQISTLLFAFIVPKLMIEYYGPQLHGLTSTIASLITYLTLVEAGLGSASVQGLYKPLYEKDEQKISSCVNAISKIYIRIGIIFTSLVVGLSLLYPLFASDGLKYSMVMILILISGLSHTIEYFFFSKYKVLLQADKRLYILNSANTIGVTIQGLLRIAFIMLKFDIYFVQLVPSIVYIIRLFIIVIYVKKNYKYLDRKAEPDYKVGEKRWNVLIHQIANLVVNNTDSIVLSKAVGYSIVSVYSVYNMVIANISGFLNQSLSHAITANFGHMLSSDSLDESRKAYDEYEKLYYYIISVIFGICCCALLPFVTLYIDNVNGVNYADPKLVVLFITNALLVNLRIPELTIVNAAGHFKQTQNHAIIESAINIIISLILVIKFGIYGVLIGTTCSFLYRDIMFIWYTNKRILDRPIRKSVVNLMRMVLIFAIIVVVGNLIKGIIAVDSWKMWIVYCILTGVASLVIVGAYILLFDRSSISVFKNLLLKK